MKTRKTSTRKWRGLMSISASLLAIAVGVSGICETWKESLDARIGTVSSKVVTEKTSNTADLYKYKSDFTSTTQLIDAHKSLAERIQEEGSVLLKNTNNALPLKGIKKVTLFGMRSHYPVYGGQIGSSPVPTQNVSFEDALQKKGFEVNPTMTKIYDAIGNVVTGQEKNFFTGKTQDVFGNQPGKLSNSFGVGNTIKGLTIGEPGLDQYEATKAGYADSFKEYNGAAIVVVGRPSSEAADFYPGKDGFTKDEGSANILGLTTNEREVIKLAKQNFKTVIVLVNSDSPVEIEELKQDAGVGAILWVGAPGNYGFLGVADILNGSVSPSGHIYDTFAVDSTSSPAMKNFGMIPYKNQDAISSGNLKYSDYRAGWYLVQAEGIYTGYKYYETRYADLVAKSGNAVSSAGSSNKSAWDYKKEVSYGFGYGLSYTNFEQKLGKVTFNDKDHTATVAVSVKNTGNASGKDVVQLYAQSPYTDYDKQYQVEKSAIQLMGFEKTKELKPGETQELTVKVDMQYLASYDYINAKTYIMDKGDYYFSIGNGAHDALNNILAAQGKTTADGMDYNGNAQNSYKWTQKDFDNKTYSVSAAGVKVTNQLNDADLNYYIPNTVTYLSRNNWEATWPKTYSGLTATEKMITQLRNNTYTIKTGEDISKSFPEKNNNISFASMKGAAFDDERWDFLLDQMKLEEAVYGIRFGGQNVKEMKSIGSFAAWEADGPIGFCDFKLGDRSVDKNSPTFISADDKNKEYYTNDMPTEPVLGATFSKELAKEQGALFGNDSLWNNTPMIWAPGMNTHRTPYNARNHEYYSEDVMLTNILGTETVKGALTKGLIMAPKHFAFNDQETNRVGVAPFMNEQKAREGDLRAFQGAFEGGALGTMTAFNRIGATYVNAHIGLMKNILRKEWGFKGFEVTDMVNGPNYISVKESVIGGVSLMLANSDDNVKQGGAWTYFTAEGVKGDATLTAAIRESYHHLLYTLANSNSLNGISESSKVVRLMTWWRATYIGLDALFAAMMLVSLIGYIVASKKSKNEGVSA